MATKSLLKTVSFKDKALTRNFVYALENAQRKTSKDVTMTRTCSDASVDEIRKMFGAK